MPLSVCSQRKHKASPCAQYEYRRDAVGLQQRRPEAVPLAALQGLRVSNTTTNGRDPSPLTAAGYSGVPSRRRPPVASRSVPPPRVAVDVGASTAEPSARPGSSGPPRHPADAVRSTRLTGLPCPILLRSRRAARVPAFLRLILLNGDPVSAGLSYHVGRRALYTSTRQDLAVIRDGETTNFGRVLSVLPMSRPAAKDAGSLMAGRPPSTTIGREPVEVPEAWSSHRRARWTFYG